MDNTREHNGHTIALRDDWTFEIAGPLIDESVYKRGFGNLIEAQNAIDERVKQNERQERVKLSIPVWLKDGSRGTVTGVHGGHLKATGVGSEDHVWPAHPHLSVLLLERKKLNERVRQITAILDKYTVRTGADYSDRNYDTAVANLQRRLDAMLNKANAELPGPPQGERLSA